MAIADQENNSTIGRSRRVVSSRASSAAKVAATKVEVVASSVAAASGPAAEAVAASSNNANFRIDPYLVQDSTDISMEYAWLEPRHDPIATDTNLAEIDFENFRNEDLAYAFSCGVRKTLDRAGPVSQG